MATQPVTDPTLGIPVDVARDGDPPHRLVAIGDSVTQGFASGAVFQTTLSYPAIVAHELGWDGLRLPDYPGVGGLPLNVERLLRTLDERYGVRIDWWEVPQALFTLRQYMDEVEDYWERGPGSGHPVVAPPRHLLAVYGWDLRDALDRTPDTELAAVRPPHDDLVNQLVSTTGRGPRCGCCRTRPRRSGRAPCSTPPPRWAGRARRRTGSRRSSSRSGPTTRWAR